MSLVNAFGEITLESTQQEIKELQSQIKDLTTSLNSLVAFLYASTPRIDTAGRVVGNNSETTQPISGTVTANVANATILTVGGYSPSNAMFDVPLHIYNNINTGA